MSSTNDFKYLTSSILSVATAKSAVEDSPVEVRTSWFHQASSVLHVPIIFVNKRLTASRLQLCSVFKC